MLRFVPRVLISLLGVFPIVSAEAVMAVQGKLGPVAPASPELQAELVRLDRQYRNGTDEAFAELEREIAALAERQGSPDDRARVWGRAAWIAGQSGIDRHAGFVRKHAAKCLEVSRDPVERGRMYSLLASAVDLSGSAFPKGRTEAAEILLKGYGEALAQELPDIAPELPVVEKIGDESGGGVSPEGVALHAAQVAARAEAEFVRDQVESREVLVTQLRDLYRPDPRRRGRTPEGPDELRALASKSLSEDQTGALIRKVVE